MADPRTSVYVDPNKVASTHATGVALHARDHNLTFVFLAQAT
jgi:hypothetical protein